MVVLKQATNMAHGIVMNAQAVRLFRLTLQNDSYPITRSLLPHKHFYITLYIKGMVYRMVPRPPSTCDPSHTNIIQLQLSEMKFTQ